MSQLSENYDRGVYTDVKTWFLLILHSCRQNKEKPVVGCHNRLFWYFTVLLHSSGQMVVKIESLISVRLASSRSSSIFRTGAGRSFKVTDLSINIAKYSKAPNDSLSFGAYSLKCVFYAGRQPRCPAGYHKVAGMLSPRRGLTVSPRCGLDALPSIIKCW